MHKRKMTSFPLQFVTGLVVIEWDGLSLYVSTVKSLTDVSYLLDMKKSSVYCLRTLEDLLSF